MVAASQRRQMNPQGAQIRPQQQPMGGQPQQGKGPGLPMPQQPNMGGQKPYQPVGANNGPFHQNPVAPVQQPMQGQFIQPLPPQGKGGAIAQPAPQQPVNNMPNNLPSGLSGLIQQPGQPMGSNMNTGFGGINGVMQQPNQGKGPQSPFNIPAQTGPVQPMGNQQGPQGKGPQSQFAQPAQTGPVQPGMYSPIYGQQNTPGSMQ
jgi:hypothetical protein